MACSCSGRRRLPTVTGTVADEQGGLDVGQSRRGRGWRQRGSPGRGTQKDTVTAAGPYGGVDVGESRRGRLWGQGGSGGRGPQTNSGAAAAQHGGAGMEGVGLMTLVI